MTAYAEVIGDPIRQSKSPLIHTFWIGKLGLDADYRAEHVTAERLEAYLAERRNDPDWRGCNVTMPHKQTIMPLLDRLEPLARRVGAVNTVIKAQDGRLVGRNTDVAGFLEPLAERLAGQHYFRMARILGTGGAARAIISGLAQHGFTLVLAGRDPAKARSLLDELAPRAEHHAATLDHFAAPTDFAFDDREGGVLTVLFDFRVSEPAADQPLDREKGVFRVGHRLALGRMTDQTLAVFREGDHGRGCPHTFGVFDYLLV